MSRGEKWAFGSVTIFMLLAVNSLSFWLVERVVPQGPTLDPNAKKESLIVLLSISAICGVVYVILRLVRIRASQRYLQYMCGDLESAPRMSPAYGLMPAIALVTLVAAGALFMAMALTKLYDGEILDPRLTELAKSPFLVIALVLLPVGAVFFAWLYHRRHEVPTLVAHGRASYLKPTLLSDREEFALRMRMWIGGLFIEGIGLLAKWIDARMSGRISIGTILRDIFFMVIGPGIAAGVLLFFLFIIPPTAWMARRALRSPMTLLALGLFGAGLAVFFFSGAKEDGSALVIVSYVLTGVGLVVATISQLSIHRFGPQPGLGMGFLIVFYLISTFTDFSTGQRGAPQSLLAWGAAALAGVVVIEELIHHWNKYNKVNLN